MKSPVLQFKCAKETHSYPSGETLYQRVKETSPVPVLEDHPPVVESGAWGVYYPGLRQIGLASDLGDRQNVQMQLDGVGLADHPDTEALLDNFKPYIMAHEIGHANFHASPVGRVLSNPYVVMASQSSLPVRLSVLSSLLAPTRTTRVMGVLAGTALGARSPLSEYLADRHALRTLQGMGAHPAVADLHRGEMLHNTAVTSGGATASLVLGLAGLGARELFDHVTKEGSLQTKKFGPFTFKIDRPAGYVKEWPRPDGSVKRFTYPVDYGYWPKIKGEDGEGLDAFVGDDEEGHLESFQKLNPDGSLDETKFLLGVSDAEREKIYKLYGTEVHARRVYETFDDVQKALDTFKTKMHGGKKLADFHAVKMARVRPEVKQYRRALQLMGNDAWDFHGTGNLSGLAGTGQIYPGKLRAAYGFGAYFSRGGPLPEYWYGRRAYNRRDGGVVLPSAHVEASGGRSIGTPIISPLPYILSEKPVPLAPGGYVVRTDGGVAAQAAMDKIQREYKLRPILREPFTRAFNEYVKDRSDKADARMTRNLLIGGGLLAAGGLAYGTYKHFKDKREAEPKLAEFHAVNPPADLSDQVGTQQYYLSRAKDFRDRHPELRAPDYYHDYGDKYVHRYMHDLSPKLSDKGQSWVSDTLTGLQRAIENKRAKDPHAFDQLERDPDAFRRFAFGSHPRAYLSAGLKDLPFKDVVRIGLTPDVKDILTPNGITQVARTAKGYVKHASNVFNALNWIPEPYQDRVQTPYQMLTSARNTPALTATQPNLRMLQISRENSQY